MDQLNLTAEEVQQLILVGKRFLINENTRPGDLRVAPLERLGGKQSALAGKIQHMDNEQLAALSRSIIAQQQVPAYASALRR